MSATGSGAGPHFDPARLRAVVFDMDGVITDTAVTHFVAWKRLFDDLLETGADCGPPTVAPFEKEDYRDYVDGKPRLDGLADFLSARGIDIPAGSPSDAADAPTMHGLAARKNAIFHDLLKKEGVCPFTDTVDLVGRLRKAGIRVAAISSSRNAEDVLVASKIRDLFEVLVDGRRAADAGLAGKPAPDIFLHAVGLLGVAPAAAAVVEDAVSGVAAARGGGFGLVIGLARGGGGAALRNAGADIVVSDLSTASVAGG